jgi:hypothetical protein
VFSESIGKIYLGVFRVCQRAPLIAWPEMVALVHAKCFPARKAASLERLFVGLRKAGLCLIHTSTRAVVEPSTQLQIASRSRYANRHRFGQPTWRYGFALTNTRTGNSRRACTLSPLIDAQARTARSFVAHLWRSGTSQFGCRCSIQSRMRVRANLSGGTS